MTPALEHALARAALERLRHDGPQVVLSRQYIGNHPLAPESIAAFEERARRQQREATDRWRSTIAELEKAIAETGQSSSEKERA